VAIVKLTADNVSATWARCLASRKDLIDVDGIVSITGMLPGIHFAFDKKLLAMHEADIASLLDQLPVEFKKSGGGGWSFLNACMDKDDHQWGEQSNVEQLVALGIAIGKARYMLPREMWLALPGGVPYFVIDD
jgi:hypothetical protein